MNRRRPPFLKIGLLGLAVLCLRAEDIDLFTRDLDLSGLEAPASDLPESAEENRNLFEAWDALPEALRAPAFPDVQDETVQKLTLPGGPFLAVPNPPHLPGAYRLLQQALTLSNYSPLAPLVVLVHADNNLSVGCRVEVPETVPLPLGTDLSTMPSRQLLVIPVQTDTANRTNPALVTAAAKLRRYALDQNLTLETRELYLLPAAPGHILFGLLIE